MSLQHGAFQRLVRLIRPVFFSEVAWRARGLLSLLIILIIAIKGFDVVLSYIGRDFMTALSRRDSEGFWGSLVRYGMAFAVGIPIIVFSRYTEERFSLFWRRWLSHWALERYFSHQAYYRLAWYRKIDNPDQRIEEDIRSFTATSLSLFLIFLQSFFALIAFTGVLSQISWMLTAAAVAYALVGSLFTYFLGRPLIQLNFEQLRLEADYRYKLIKVRDNAEAIALYRGHRKERTRVRQRLKRVLHNMLLIVLRNRKLNFFTNSYNYILIVLPTVIVAPLYLKGEIEFGVVTQAGIAFGQVINALSVIVTNFGSLSSYAAVVRRLGAFVETLDEASQERPAELQPHENAAGRLSFEHVDVATPDKRRTLVRDLSFELNSGGMLISGASGSGKSTVIRAMMGLWPQDRGIIIRPSLQDIMVLPQKPYLVLGTLRNQLHYGLSRHGLTDVELRGVLKEAELEPIFDRIGGFDVTVDWAATLSTGEQQRIGLARALLQRPRYLILDEATTAIEEEGEERFYAKIKEFCTWYISMGYRATLARHHSKLLQLHGDGSWSLHPLEGGAQ